MGKRIIRWHRSGEGVCFPRISRLSVARDARHKAEIVGIFASWKGVLLGFHCPPLRGGCVFVVGVVGSTLQLTTLPFFSFSVFTWALKSVELEGEMLGSNYDCGVVLFVYLPIVENSPT